MKRPALLLLALAAALSLSGCGEDAAPADEIRYASTKDIRDINPHLYLGEMAAQNMVFEPLVVNAESGVKPWLAKSWDISADGRVYTFRLRDGVKFSDGEPFTAEAVKQNLDAVAANLPRHQWLDLANAIEKTEAPDPLTFRLTLRHPYYPALTELALTRPFRFISPRCFKDGGTAKGVSCLAGTGPWVLSEHKRNQYALFEQNPLYWGEKPKARSVRWRVMPDPQAMLLALEKGEIDLIYGSDGDQLNLDAFEKLAREGKFATEISAPVASRAILMNTRGPVTGEAAVREALEHAVDKDAIAKGVLNGTEAKAETLLSPSVPYCDAGLKPKAFDPELAAALLDKAGWVPGPDGTRAKAGRRLEFTLWFNAKNAQEKTIAEYLQSDLKKIGADLRIAGEEKQAFLDRQRTGAFDLMYSLSWGTPYDPQSYLSSWRIPAHGDYQAQLGLPRKAWLDAEITRLMAETNSSKRAAMVRGILAYIHDSDVYIPLSYSRTKAVHAKRLVGVGFLPSQYEIPFEKMSLAAPR